jgi:hypothetical protein
MKKINILVIALGLSILLGLVTYGILWMWGLTDMLVGPLGIAGLTFILTVYGLKKWKK